MGDFFSASDDAAYTPLPAPGFRPCKIVLARGSRTSPGRRTMTEQICQAYPEAEVVDQLEVPHNRIDLGEADAAFTRPEVYEFLEAEAYRYALRLPSNDVL